MKILTTESPCDLLITMIYNSMSHFTRRSPLRAHKIASTALLDNRELTLQLLSILNVIADDSMIEKYERLLRPVFRLRRLVRPKCFPSVISLLLEKQPRLTEY